MNEGSVLRPIDWSTTCTAAEGEEKAAVVGSLLAGIYGILHDQVTYSISHEYFTRLKFSQFHYANFGLSHRVFVAEMGFLATWWVGFFAGWFIARITVASFPRAAAFRHSLRGFLIVFAFAFGTAIVGYVLGILHRSDYSAWDDLASALGIVDLPGFVRVAYIHNASYLGGLVGLVIIDLRTLKCRAAVAQVILGSHDMRLLLPAAALVFSLGFGLPGSGPKLRRNRPRISSYFDLLCPKIVLELVDNT